MTSANKKGALLFIGGLVLGGLVTNNHWSSAGNIAEQELSGIKEKLALSQEQWVNAQEKMVALETVLSEQDSQAATGLALRQKNEKQIETLQSTIAEITAQSTQMTERNLALEEQGDLQRDAIAKLTSRLKNTDVLYAERYRLARAVSDLNEQILKVSHKSETSQKACDEFKKGNSWNWVSEKDCSDFNEYRQQSNKLMNEFDDTSAELDKVKRELSAFGNLPYPAPLNDIKLPSEERDTTP
ncbi:hypothetical protein [Enterovibrio calviensis]|uniref:hypothetical protein n=1 Tax=Enterovibrio calviensis TaxID=91359 RepID=UPI00068558F9|nr:hypothetical protein [Enterovibrio calviensis]